jgi:hypothetical protein
MALRPLRRRLLLFGFLAAASQVACAGPGHLLLTSYSGTATAVRKEGKSGSWEMTRRVPMVIWLAFLYLTILVLPALLVLLVGGLLGLFLGGIIGGIKGSASRPRRKEWNWRPKGVTWGGCGSAPAGPGLELLVVSPPW